MPLRIPGFHVYRPEHPKNRNSNPGSQPTLRIFGTDVHLGRAPRPPGGTAASAPRAAKTQGQSIDRTDAKETNGPASKGKAVELTVEDKSHGPLIQHSGSSGHGPRGSGATRPELAELAVQALKTDSDWSFVSQLTYKDLRALSDASSEAGSLLRSWLPESGPPVHIPHRFANCLIGSAREQQWAVQYLVGWIVTLPEASQKTAVHSAVAQIDGIRAQLNPPSAASEAAAARVSSSDVPPLILKNISSTAGSVMRRAAHTTLQHRFRNAAPSMTESQANDAMNAWLMTHGYPCTADYAAANLNVPPALDRLRSSGNLVERFFGHGVLCASLQQAPFRLSIDEAQDVARQRAVPPLNP